MSTATTAGAAAAPRPRRRRSKQTRFLAQSIVLEEIGPPNILRVVLFLAGAAVAGLLGWAYVSPLAERVSAAGQVVPTGQVLSVQHWEGGIVAALPVSDGAVVRPGDVLVRLDATAARSELEETSTRIVALALRAERLRAFAESREPAFAAIDAGGVFPELVADQRQILAEQHRKAEDERTVLSHVIDQRLSSLKALREQEETLVQEVKIVEELAQMREGLSKKGLISRVVYLGTMQQLVASRGELRKVRTEAARALQAIAESRGQITQLDSGLRSAALNEVGQVSAEIAQLRRVADKARDKVTRLEIRSPVHGVVKGMMPNTIGGVIQPGMVVAEIVPLDQELVAEVRIAPPDVGRLHEGQPVTVKVSAYDFYRYGAVEGTLERVSASTYQEQDGTLYYKGTVRLASGEVGRGKQRHRILPGMTIDADINTGTRTMLEYLLKPIYVSISDAFGEK
jgi:HlyD family secretion protein/adhesin transport system membrane fusion protein